MEELLKNQILDLKEKGLPTESREKLLEYLQQEKTN